MAIKSESMVEAIVRRGTVIWGNPENPQQAAPGDKITIAESEAIALKARGILVDDRNGPPALGIGPKFGLDVEAGPVVAAA